MKNIPVETDAMTLEDLVAIARKGAKVRLTKDSAKRIAKSRKLIEQSKARFPFDHYFVPYGKYLIWGATARILKIFFERVEGERRG